MKNYYIFLSYKNEKDYPLKPYFTKVFKKKHFDKMKEFSAKHSKKEKEKHSQYCSNYTTIEL